MALTQYLFSFKGRITRRGFWLRYVLPAFAIWILVGALIPLDIQMQMVRLNFHPDRIGWDDAADVSLTTFGVCWLVAHYAFFGWLGAVASVKRLHDRNQSGWLAAITFVPAVGLLWFFGYLGFFPGSKGPNRFGPDPRAKRNSDRRQPVGAT